MNVIYSDMYIIGANEIYEDTYVSLFIFKWIRQVSKHLYMT